MLDKDNEKKTCSVGGSINWGNDSMTSGSSRVTAHLCPHRLPCGVCERTNRMCPLEGWYDSPVVWSTNTSGGIKND